MPSMHTHMHTFHMALLSHHLLTKENQCSKEKQNSCLASPLHSSRVWSVLLIRSTQTGWAGPPVQYPDCSTPFLVITIH